MMLGIGTKLVDLSRPKGPTTPPPPAVTWYIELENGLGFLELQNTTDLLLQEAAP
jgi:hypothetical protein